MSHHFALFVFLFIFSTAYANEPKVLDRNKVPPPTFAPMYSVTHSVAVPRMEKDGKPFDINHYHVWGKFFNADGRELRNLYLDLPELKISIDLGVKGYAVDVESGPIGRCQSLNLKRKDDSNAQLSDFLASQMNSKDGRYFIEFYLIHDYPVERMDTLVTNFCLAKRNNISIEQPKIQEIFPNLHPFLIVPVSTEQVIQ